MAPTHKVVDVDIVVVRFRDGKIAAERIDWDQATVLRQIGRLADEPGAPPVDRRGPGTPGVPA